MGFIDSNLSATNVLSKRLLSALGVGLLALGLSSGVAAHELEHRGGYGKQVVHNHYYEQNRGHARKQHRRAQRRADKRHRRAHRSTREVVTVHHYYQEPAPVVYRSQVQHGHSQNDSAYSPAGQINPGSLMGAALGGLIGSQVGRGNGQLAATAAGTVGGFLLGDHATRGYR